MMNSAQINRTVEGQLCHSCGACAAVCPTDAIHFEESPGGHLYPHIEEDRCTDCGMCLRVCAGEAGGSTLSDALPQEPFHGECRGAWVGRSNDETVYGGAQSGGVVSQFLIDLLETGEVDGCAVVTMPPGNPPRPAAVIAKSREDVLRAQKSKYCPVPVLQLLRDAVRAKRRIALVGLPCHFHGLEMLQPFMDVRSVVAVRIGLVCDRVMSTAAVDYFFKRASLSGTKRSVVFRDKTRTGYPGEVTVQDEGGSVSVIPGSERMAIKDIMTPARCRLCFDKMNVLADVVVGDPWGIAGAGLPNGESVVIARTEAGRRLVDHAVERGSLSLRPVDYGEVMRGQGMDRKVVDWRSYCEIWQAVGRTLPGVYESVRLHAPERTPTQAHKRCMAASVALGEVRQREVLLSETGKTLARRQRLRRLLLPYHMACRVFCKAR